MSTQGYEPRHRTSGSGRTAGRRRRGSTITVVAGLLLGASLMYAPAYASSLLGSLIPGATSVAHEQVEPRVTDVDSNEELNNSNFDDPNSEVAPSSPAGSDSPFIVEFTDVDGIDGEGFICHDDTFDEEVEEPDSLEASEEV